MAGFGSRQTFREQVRQPDAAATEYYQQQRGPAEGYWWPEVASRDTYAQWAMTGVAIVATGISILGVVLIRRTFEETKRTADAAVSANNLNRQIHYATIRPYLEIEQVTLGQYDGADGDSNWFVTVQVTNTSKFRAIDVSCQTSVMKRPLMLTGNDSVAEFSQAFLKESRSRGSIIIPPDGEQSLFDLGDGELPPQGEIGGWMITVCVRYRSNVNPDFYYVAANYNVGSIADMFVPDPIDGSSEASITGALISESQTAT